MGLIINAGRDFILNSAMTAAASMPPGYYGFQLTPMGVLFSRQTVSGENISEVNHSQAKLFKVIQDFWAKKHLYTKMRVRHRLGVMLHGKPGTGKSVAMRKAIQDTVAVGGFALDVDDLDAFPGALSTLRLFYPTAPVLAVCEDMDGDFVEHDIAVQGDRGGVTTMSNRGEVLELESSWTHLLDGIGSEMDGVLFLASTNSIGLFSDRLLRAGRFDVKVEIQPPNAKERAQIIAELWEVPLDHPEVGALTKATEGQVIAEVKAQAVRHYIDGKVTTPEQPAFGSPVLSLATTGK